MRLSTVGRESIFNCHPEFISGSLEMLEQVQHDILSSKQAKNACFFGTCVIFALGVD